MRARTRARRGVLESQEPEARPAGRGRSRPRARLWPALCAVYRAQLSRARVARIPLLFVATFQSLGIMVLMRGVVDGGAEARAVVAGSSVLVVAFVALNLLAQYFGQLRASGGPGPLRDASGARRRRRAGRRRRVRLLHRAGCRGHGRRGKPALPAADGRLWVLIAVIPLAGAALAGLGAALGLLAPRPELATLVRPVGHVGGAAAGRTAGRGHAAARRSGYAICCRPPTASRRWRAHFAARPDWGAVVRDLAVCAAVGVLSLAVATWAYRWAATR